MIYALDTNIISYLLRPSRNPAVVQRFMKEIKQGNDYVIPPLCYYEILWYLFRKKASSQIRVFEELYQNAKEKIIMIEQDFLTAATIKAQLNEQGIPIDDADIFIAASCLSNSYTLVTNNVSHFKRVEGLKLVNWAR